MQINTTQLEADSYSHESMVSLASRRILCGTKPTKTATLTSIHQRKIHIMSWTTTCVTELHPRWFYLFRSINKLCNSLFNIFTSNTVGDLCSISSGHVTCVFVNLEHYVQVLKGPRFTLATIDQRKCINSGFTAESLGLMLRGSLRV
jgi:hypothetical protein